MSLKNLFFITLLFFLGISLRGTVSSVPLISRYIPYSPIIAIGLIGNRVDYLNDHVYDITFTKVLKNESGELPKHIFVKKRGDIKSYANKEVLVFGYKKASFYMYNVEQLGIVVEEGMAYVAWWLLTSDQNEEYEKIFDHIEIEGTTYLKIPISDFVESIKMALDYNQSVAQILKDPLSWALIEKSPMTEEMQKKLEDHRNTEGR